MKDVSVKDMVFLEETEVNLVMVNLSARAIKGQSADSKQTTLKSKSKNVLDYVLRQYSRISRHLFMRGSDSK